MDAVSLAAGIVLAAGAATCFDAGAAWQAHEARRLPPERGRGRLMLDLARRPRWVLASALAVGGWPLQVAALTLAPLTVVQPTLAGGLIVLLVLASRVLGERVGRAEIAGAALIIAGVAILAWAAPERETLVASAPTLVAVIGALTLAAVLPWALQAPPVLSTFAAGAAAAGNGVTSKVVSDGLAAGSWPAVLGAGAVTAVLAWVAVANEMSAVQRRAATRVIPVILVVEVVVPVLLAPVIAGEHWPHTAAVLLGLAVVAAGTVPLAQLRVSESTTSAAAGSDP